MADCVHLTRNGRILEIVFERPPANAINRAASYALYEAFRTLNEDPELLVGIVTGGGERFFSAGWDLKEVASGDELANPGELDLGPGGIGGLPEFWGLTKPVIAAINGMAVGGGFEMAMAADILIAAEHAEFFLPEMERGFVPDGGGVQRLPRLLPRHVAADLMYTGRRMGAREAAHWGLVREVVPASDLMARARDVAGVIAAGAPLAVQALKESMTAFASVPVEEAFALSKRACHRQSGLTIYERMLFSEDYSEGPRAFAEKRPPVWQGR